MCCKTLTAVVYLACLIGAACASAQALAGTYTCANGNPGGAFDYADIGGFFNDLEEYGVNAPVVLEVYDDGGTFVSNASYQLGANGNGLSYIPRPVSGISQVNTLTIRAAPGEHPVVTGRGATSYLTATPWTFGCIAFDTIGFTTIEGMEFTGGDFGIHWLNYLVPNGSDHIRISRCKIHGMLNGSAIGITGWGNAPVNNVTIENNMLWDCYGPGTGQVEPGIIGAQQCGFEWVVRNNTVVHATDDITDGLGTFAHHGVAWSEFCGNVVHLQHVNNTFVFNGSSLPFNADRNIVHLAGPIRMSTNQLALDWAGWQAAGLDPNGLNTDPLLVSVTPGSEDLRLRPDSPAIDLIPSGGPALDVFGNPRPYGSGFDAGAHELQNFGARAGLAAASALVGPSGGPYSISLNHGDALADVLIELSDFESKDITVTSITASAALAGVAAPAIPAPSHPLTLAWTGFIDDTNPPGTYTWTVEFADAGTGFVMTCEVSITVTTPPPVALHTPNPLPAGRVAQDYSLALQATGTGTLVFSLLSGDLPSGLSLSATGQITGTPGTDGEYTFTVQAADNFTKEQQDYEISIKPKPPPDTGSGSCSVSMAQRGRGGSSPANRALALAALVFFIGTLALARRRR